MIKFHQELLIKFHQKLPHKLTNLKAQKMRFRPTHFIIVHELMHSFGAKHDPDPTEEPECTPQDKVGIFIKFMHFFIGGVHIRHL